MHTAQNSTCHRCGVTPTPLLAEMLNKPKEPEFQGTQFGVPIRAVRKGGTLHPGGQRQVATSHPPSRAPLSFQRTQPQDSPPPQPHSPTAQGSFGSHLGTTVGALDHELPDIHLGWRQRHLSVGLPDFQNVPTSGLAPCSFVVSLRENQ